MQIPALIIAGDSVSWNETALSDPVQGALTGAGGWSLTYSFRGQQGAGGIDVAATAAGTGWTMALTSAQTAALNAGTAVATWAWLAWCSSGAKRISVGTGVLRVQPNLAGVAAGSVFDGRSQAEKDLEAIRAELSARVTGGLTVEYTIGARSLKKEPVTALMAMEQRCLRIVARERRAQATANGLGNPKRFAVRFK